MANTIEKTELGSAPVVCIAGTEKEGVSINHGWPEGCTANGRELRKLQGLFSKPAGKTLSLPSCSGTPTCVHLNTLKWNGA